MHNPFETIHARLTNLELLTLETLELLRQTAPAPETGGIELAQEITRLSKARIYALVSGRDIPHTKRGNRLSFERATLLAWMGKHKRGHNETAADA